MGQPGHEFRFGRIGKKFLDGAADGRHIGEHEAWAFD